VTSDGYDRMVELVAEDPGLSAEELVAMSTDEGFDAGDARGWLQEALERNDVLEFDGKYWVMRSGEYAFAEFDHPES